MPFSLSLFPFLLSPCSCLKLSALVVHLSTFLLPIFYYLAFGPSTLFLMFLFVSVYTAYGVGGMDEDEA